jgi:spore germination protein YaaH
MKKLQFGLVLSLCAFAFSFISFAIPADAATARSLYAGLSGTDVKTLQETLISKGYLAAGKATGYFGSLTEAAVKKFQCEKGIICSGAAVSGYGVAGPKTQAALSGGGAQPATNVGGALTPAATGAFEVSGWIPYWRVASGTADVLPHIQEFKSLMPFAYSVKADGTLADTANLSSETWKNFIAEAKQRGVRIVPTVMWGDGDTIHAVLSNDAARIALEDEIARVARENGFDGIDIDFEAKKAETKDYFSTFLKGLYQRLGNKWLYCTVEIRMPLEDRYLPGATIPPDATLYANDYREMNKYCDRIEIMTYDQGTVAPRLNAARSAPFAPVADPGWVESIVNLASQTISRNKLIVGIATYGYEYAVTPLSGSGFRYERQWAFNPKYATDIAAKLGITPMRTSAGELGFTYSPNALATVAPSGSDSTQTQQSLPATTIAENLGSSLASNQPFNYMTWSDAKAMQDKIDVAERLGVRGVAFFSLGGAQDPGIWDVLKKI